MPAEKHRSVDDFMAQSYNARPRNMKRPLPVLIFSCLFIFVGSLGLGYHLTKRPLEHDFLLLAVLRLLAVVGGIFLLLGHNWARWLLLAWLAFHVVVSFYHSVIQVALHTVFFLVFAFFLFRPATAKYFHTGP